MLNGIWGFFVIGGIITGAFDSLEIFVDENMIILKKYEPADIFTGSMEDLIDFKEKECAWVRLGYGFPGRLAGRFPHCSPTLFTAISHGKSTPQKILLRRNKIVRKVDELGRVVLPIELRRNCLLSFPKTYSFTCIPAIRAISKIEALDTFFPLKSIKSSILPVRISAGSYFFKCGFSMVME